MTRYETVIVGAGPAGLSAAARAAELDRERGSSEPSYVLLEGSGTFAQTIQKYQKGKHVMAEPGYLNLRSPMPFEPGRREAILDAWNQTLSEHAINVRYNAEVKRIEGSKGDFTIGLQNGDTLSAAHIVLSIGTQGNPRTLGVEREAESNFVVYSLADADAHRDKHITVVGAGDAAIENAIALARGNKVTIVNRRAEFSRAKEGNLNAILAAINDPEVTLECRYESSVGELEPPDAEGRGGAILLRTPAGEERLDCDLLIARLGTIPPRSLIESFGIAIDSPDPTALPQVDQRYQSNVPGLYVIGALGGYPLIKQAMNQGYEAIDYINGMDTRPADYELLAAQFSALPYALDAEQILKLYQDRVPMFRRMNALAFRELIVESKILFVDETVSVPDAANERCTVRIPPDHVLYEDGEYSSSFFTLVEGSARLQLEDDGPWADIRPGEFFGEMSLISGRPRQGSAIARRDSILIETPRRIMVKLMASNDEIREGIDRVFIIRALLAAFRSGLELKELGDIATRVGQHTLEAGEALYSEGEEGDKLYLIRRGRIALSRGDARQVVNQLHSGELVGQLALMGAPERRETAVAAVRTDVLSIGQQEFLRLAGKSGDYLPVLQERLADNLRRSNAIGAQSESARTMNFLIERGMGEATNALLINESLCIGCDNCERACAETHGGISRVNRHAEHSHNNWHIAQACMHCELPHCMKDCPTDAIRRDRSGEVFITDACIGCGNCETNCPYNAITLRYPAPKKPGLFSWLFFGLGSGPGDQKSNSPPNEDAAKVATKCDACRELKGTYACVRACPTGAAIRVGADEFIDLVGDLSA